jgi:pimeloyl-ACP methyl ester carboxylesterase
MRDNTRLFYIDTHVGQPIVFIASAWLNSRMREFQIPYFLDQGFRCVVYDRRGTSSSPTPTS